MDNVTHTLVGLAVGEFASRRARSPSPSLRAALWTVSGIANNFPDLDFLYSFITAAPLGYLLHHRGHTHTLLFAIPQAVLLLLVVHWFAKRRGIEWSHRDRSWLVGVAVLGPVLHIAMDALNSYGVHPFWPFDSRWYYGDAVFIIEPLLWTALAIPLAFTAHRWTTRVLLLLPVFAGPWAGYVTKMVPPPGLVALIGLTVIFAVVLWRLSDHARGLALVVAPTVVIIVFITAGVKVRRDLMAGVAEPGWRIESVVLSPMPANPLCWMALVVRSDGKTGYRIRRGRASAAPGIVDPGKCVALPRGGLVPLVDIPQTDRAARWTGEYRGDLSELRRLSGERCDLAAFLRFARVPYLLFGADGGIAGDMRFENGTRGNFAMLTLPARIAGCPSFIPGWEPPAGWARKSSIK